MKYILLCKPNWIKPSSLNQNNSVFSTLIEMRWYLILSVSLLILNLINPELFKHIINSGNSNELLLGQFLFLGHIPIGRILNKLAKSLSVKPTNSDHLSLSDIHIEDYIDDEIRFTKAEEMRLKNRYSSKENHDGELAEEEPLDDLWRDEPEYIKYTFDLQEINVSRNSLKQDIRTYFQTVGFHLFVFACFFSAYHFLNSLF
jgi:hypothetical protein